MTQAEPHSKRRDVQLQLAIVIAAFALLLLIPNTGRALLLVPVLPAAGPSLARLAVDGGATLVAAGSLPGSIVVREGSARFRLRMMAAGILPIATAAAGCGTRGGRAA